MILISGHMDPLHDGHLAYIEHAANVDDEVVVALNSDAQTCRKKGYVFMPYTVRERILLALRDVSDVVMADDEDGTVCSILKELRPTYFGNGGDRTSPNSKEDAVCRYYGIIQLFNLGGGKINSSSRLVNDYHKNAL